MPTGDAYSSGHLVLSIFGLAFVLLVETSDTLYRYEIIPVCDIITGPNNLTECEFQLTLASIEHLQRVWHADRGCLLLRTPDPVPFGLAYVLLVETNPFPNSSLFFRTMLFEYPSVRFCFYLMKLRQKGSRQSYVTLKYVTTKNCSFFSDQ